MTLRRQQGVAVVTALLLTALAITIVASLFWQQQVQVRSIENQRFQLQKKWVLRGALDWAGLILREDGRISFVDHLGEPWAINLGETRLDQYVENGRTEVEDSEASLSGQISDAQAKYNLTNLAENGEIVKRELAVFSKLLKNLNLDSGLAQHVAAQMAATQGKRIKSIQIDPNTSSTAINPGTNSGSSSGIKGGSIDNNAANTTNNPDDPVDNLSATDTSTVQFLSFSQTDDLLAVPGFDVQIVRRLKNFVTVLPVLQGKAKAKVNVNTTSAEVLSACLVNASMADAALMIATRDRAHFIDMNNFKLNFQNKISADDELGLDFASDFFIVNGKVKLNRSLLEVNALFYRDKSTHKTKVLWVRES